MDIEQATARARELNDAFRRSFVGGAVEVTEKVKELSPEIRTRVLARIRDYDLFEDTDADEHDGGLFVINGIHFSWTIYCFNREMTAGSEDPADPEKTTRVLSVSLAEEV